MKKHIVLILGLVLILALVTTAAFAQAGYDLSWWTVDGGGAVGLSADGYTLSGTIGQPDAGTLSGGDYELSGGFWGGAAAQAAAGGALYLPLVVR